jgi:hypothetical protein
MGWRAVRPPVPLWTAEDQRLRPEMYRELRARLQRYNRALAAERENWPRARLRACEKLDKQFPGWLIDWLDENTIKGFERPACFVAVNEDRNVTVYAPDAERLAEEVDNAPPERQWHMVSICPKGQGFKA